MRPPSCVSQEAGYILMTIQKLEIISGRGRDTKTSEDKERQIDLTMKLAILIALLGMTALCMGRRDRDNSESVADSRSSDAFISRQESANFAQRNRQSNIHNL
ncbi:osteocalcin precursor [Pelobates cultripes]|nr:osteocalcin precursor [Pelobates cultripes]